MIEKETLEILKSEIDLLEKELRAIKIEKSNNKELQKIKELLQNNKQSIIDININRFFKLLENYHISNFDNFKNDIKYIKYIYKFYYLHKGIVDFPQKEIADTKYENIINIINQINISNENYEEETSNIYNRLKLVYNKLTKDLYTIPITEYDVINYIIKSPNLSKEQKQQFEKNINDYNKHIYSIISSHEIEIIKEKNDKQKERKIEPYIKSFCEMLKVIEEDQIIKYLPNSTMENCVHILESIIEYTEYEINKNDNIISKNKQSKVVQSLETENLKLKNIKNSVKHYLDKVLQEQELEENFGENIFINKIIYLNNYIFNDLKDITQEEYESVNNSIDALINGDLSTNTAKHRKLKNNINLKNVFEVKRSRVRLFYTPIGNNTYVILLLGQKNTNNDSVLIEKAEKRISEFKSLKRNKRINIDDSIEKGLEITEQLKTELDVKKRGV